MKKQLWIFLMLLGAFCYGCAGCVRQTAPQAETGMTDSWISAASLNSWCVYWDAGTADAVADYGNQMDALVLFACVYDDEGKLYIPPQLQSLYETFPQYEGQLYLSFVNDVIHGDGTATLKSTELLQQVFSSRENMEQCAEAMAGQAVRWGCDGMELDFENMGKLPNAWASYVQFVEAAHTAAQSHGLLCRVVLSATFPVEDYPLPDGPEYTVMCYNLYGSHSGPGPKADQAFLEQTAQKFSQVPGIRFALANGGFEWDAESKALSSMTVQEAENLAREQGVYPSRDSDSQAMAFTYLAEDGNHTVWYGDKETLQFWCDKLSECMGEKASVDLWRIE